mmetsp:Transcript_88756/g.147479  ORF Transcript_88756/g.147479 Transcript_88756/m.147479 type:complete len:226 (+) Transcript_88756:464-1141(+)
MPHTAKPACVKASYKAAFVGELKWLCIPCNLKMMPLTATVRGCQRYVWIISLGSRLLGILASVKSAVHVTLTCSGSGAPGSHGSNTDCPISKALPSNIRLPMFGPEAHSATCNLRPTSSPTESWGLYSASSKGTVSGTVKEGGVREIAGGAGVTEKELAKGTGGGSFAFGVGSGTSGLTVGSGSGITFGVGSGTSGLGLLTPSSSGGTSSWLAAGSKPLGKAPGM